MLLIAGEPGGGGKVEEGISHLCIARRFGWDAFCRIWDFKTKLEIRYQSHNMTHEFHTPKHIIRFVYLIAPHTPSNNNNNNNKTTSKQHQNNIKTPNTVTRKITQARPTRPSAPQYSTTSPPPHSSHASSCSSPRSPSHTSV